RTPSIPYTTLFRSPAADQHRHVPGLHVGLHEIADRHLRQIVHAGPPTSAIRKGPTARNLCVHLHHRLGRVRTHSGRHLRPPHCNSAGIRSAAVPGTVGARLRGPVVRPAPGVRDIGRGGVRPGIRRTPAIRNRSLWLSAKPPLHHSRTGNWLRTLPLARLTVTLKPPRRPSRSL